MMGRYHAYRECRARCEAAWKLRPQAWPSAAVNDIFSASAALVTLFCTVPAGAYGSSQSATPRGERSTWPHKVRSLGRVFFAIAS
jgi:hypothetical protein